MTTQHVPTVARTTCWWSLTPGEGGKVTGSEWLHGAVNHFTLVEADGTTTTVDHDVDKGWTNSSTAPTRFRGAPHAALRGSVGGRLAGLVNTSCLLDQVMDLVVTLPTGWKWDPRKEHPDGIVFVGGDPASAEARAVGTHLVAVRGAVEIRNVLMGLLNVTEFKVTTNTRLQTQTTETVRISWGPVVNAGRQVVIAQLRARAAVLGGPPSSEPYSSTMNGLIADAMFRADRGLSRLVELGLIAVGGTDGQPFKAKKGRTEMVEDRSGALQAAYNHIRFLLYMEWRALHELV